MTDLLNALIEGKKDVKAVHFSNGWIEFDTNEDYENACRWAEEKALDWIDGEDL
jgi:NDP-sugar pyrophosphorylase family protein